jgi:signal-transduction protein with cAMP-binding, CBS, and nucleotidyltransferase domain
MKNDTTFRIFSTTTENHPQIRYRYIMFKSELVNNPVFTGMTGDQMDQIFPLMELCQYPQDHLIFQQGQKAEYLYILLKGEVIIRYKPYDGPPLDIAHIEPDGVFGWSSTLGRSTYTSAAVTATETVAYRIGSRQLSWLCQLFPRTGVILLHKLANVISQGLTETQSQVFDMLSQGVFISNGRKG